MIKEFKISSFEDLIEFIKTQDVPAKDITEIIADTMSIYTSLEDNFNRDDLVNKLKDYWIKWKNIRERPFFLY
ncbi:hypothetical protein [Aestuariivivens sediminicola]|uniref:hypothetical protein n=1 Tax=Aestuariivivens sediminicola TaxID=2913560 RepID=UPI001F588D43|nr:hypothetical protein [Aestuariivivens sediminicola]